VNQSIQNKLQTFDGAKAIDLSNEKRPEGIEKALSEASKTPSSPDAIRRKSSKDMILFNKASREIKMNKFVIKEAPKIIPDIKEEVHNS